MLRALFLDIGGVLLTNGWGTNSRKEAAKTFGYNFEEAEKRHHLMYSTHELGKLSLESYIEFTYPSVAVEDYEQFMYEQSKPYPDMLELMKELKEKHGLKIGVVSNEGQELTTYRVENWLISFVDFFCVSGFVGYRKPDPDIFHLATNAAQIPPQETAYIDDREVFATMASRLGFKGIHHTAIESTKRQLEELL